MGYYQGTGDEWAKAVEGAESAPSKTDGIDTGGRATARVIAEGTFDTATLSVYIRSDANGPLQLYDTYELTSGETYQLDVSTWATVGIAARITTLTGDGAKVRRRVRLSEV